MSKLNVFPLGQKGAVGEYDNVLGQKQSFTSQPATRTNGVFLQSDGIAIETILVRNASGGNLTPGRVVNWASGLVGTGAGAACAAGDVGAGMVDPFLTGVVANGEVFHLIREGRLQGMSGAAIAANAQVVPDTGGKLITMPATVAGVAARCGRAWEAAGAADQVRYFVLDFEV